MSAVNRMLTALIAIAVLVLGIWMIAEEPESKLHSELSPNFLDSAVARNVDVDLPDLPTVSSIDFSSPESSDRRALAVLDPAAEKGSLRGRVLNRLVPARNALVTLKRVARQDSGRGLQVIERIGSKRAGIGGGFAFGELRAGDYLLEVDGGPLMQPESLLVQLGEGEHRRLHDVLLKRNTDGKRLAREQARPTPAVLRILTDHPGLEIELLANNGSYHDSRAGRTDEFGEAIVNWDRGGAVRIDVKGSTGTLLGTTEVFQTYPAGVETVIRIPSSPGRLKLQLPRGAEVGPGEALQYILRSDEGGDSGPLSETVRGDSPVGKSRGIQSTADSLEFDELRATRYGIEALRLVKRPNGRWVPAGERWHGVAQVLPGEITVCQLN